MPARQDQQAECPTQDKRNDPTLSRFFRPLEEEPEYQDHKAHGKDIAQDQFHMGDLYNIRECQGIPFAQNEQQAEDQS